MKKITIIIIIVHASLFTTHLCKAQWQWMNPKPFRKTIVSVCFVDANHGWMAGEGGHVGIPTIMHTSDGGLSWEEQESGSNSSLHDICFFDESYGWAVGSASSILRTIDGGVTWNSNNQYSIRLPSGLTGVCFVDRQRGWAVGWAAAAPQGPIIWQTTDGGETWDYQVYNSTFLVDKHSVCFVDSLQGWIAWSNQIIHTSDGGNTWEDQLSNTQNNLQNIFFFDSDYGWSVGEGGTVLCTTNGGGSWEPSIDTSLVGTILCEVSFIDANTGWAAGYNDNDEMSGVIFNSTDGGVSWEQQTTDPAIGSIYCLTFENGSDGFAAGKEGEYLKASDGGTHWERIYNSVTNCDFRDVFFVDEQKGWAVGGLDTGDVVIPEVYYSPNGGFSWIAQEIPFVENQPFEKVYFADDLHGWIMGGGLFTTTDGGDNWVYQSDDETGNDIYFINPDIGWRIGTEGKIQKTLDGGWSWVDKLSGTDRNLNALFFINEFTGWITGDSIILSTHDGGENWTTQLTGGYSWSCVHFIDEQQGWVSGLHYQIYGGSHGKVMQTMDGGNSWSELDNGDIGFENIYFADLNKGWGDGRAFGPGGLWGFYGIWYTEDGGLSWEIQDLHGLQGNGGFCFIDAEEGWVVGENGTILHTDNGGITDITEFKVQNSRFNVELYPNPTSRISHFLFHNSQYQYVALKIYDLFGREVAVVVDEKLPAGEHEVRYDMTGLPQGVYVVELRAEGAGHRAVGKVVKVN